MRRRGANRLRSPCAASFFRWEPRHFSCSFASVEVELERDRITPPRTAAPQVWPGFRGMSLGAVLIVAAYLCWLVVAPFLPAVSWAFALALLAHPFYKWLVRNLRRENAAATIAVVVVLLTLVVPAVFLARVLVQEAAAGIDRITDPSALSRLRGALENSAVLGSLFRWIDSQVELPKESIEAVRALARWISAAISSVITGSAWFITQVITMVVVLFYFLRDQQTIVGKLRALVPLEPSETDRVFARIATVIRTSVYGKVLVAAIQGSLGGLIFWWLGLPAPVFWGFVMALLSIVPLLGAFVIWVPAAVVLASQGLWTQALILTAWGVLVVHPVDNLLGPVLVGTTLRMHTLLIFFAVVGGMAAFGASGIVLGPVTLAVTVSLLDIWESRTPH